MRAWYSFKTGGIYKGSAPPYFDVQDKKWYTDLVKHLPEIQQATIEFVKNSDSKRREYFNTELVEGLTWEGFSLLLWGKRNEANIKKGEKLFDYFKDIPGLISFSISILAPNTHIVEHYGDTDAVYRLHVPILIPAMLPECGFKVSGIAKSWDHILCFCDAHRHEAWNNTARPRIILMVDILREEFLSQGKTVRNNVLSLLELQKLYLNHKIVRNAPWYAKGILRHLLLWRIQLTGRSTMSGH